GDGFPALFPCTEVTLASSALGTAQVPQGLEETCEYNVQYLMGSLSAGSVPGEATITATASGLKPDAANVMLQGKVPVQLRTYLAPGELISVESPPGYVAVQALDIDGVPTRLHDGIPLTLVGAEELIDATAEIAPGRSFAALPLKGLTEAKEAQIWTAGTGLQPAQLSVVTQTLPLGARMDPIPGPVFQGEQVEILVQVASDGAPLANAQIEWRSPSGILTEFVDRTNVEGEATATFLATVPGDSLVEVTAAKGGYEGAKAETTVPVVEVLPVETDRPSLYGIPVVYLTVVLLMILIGYIGTKVASPITRRLSLKWPRQFPSR
ncbi:MAG: hypothetical protein ACE5Q6_26440, partial [Dehalococcoidia bacterium]